MVELPGAGRVVVLGAGGFVGGAILRAVAAAGLRPIAGLHHAPRAAPLPDHARICDATDARAVSRAVAGADYAVNAVLGNAATMLSATANLCAAARAAGLRRIVHISSMSVYGDRLGLVDETAPLAGGRDRYGAAKIACEAVIRDFAAQGGEAAILRPGIVYGPGGEQWVGRIGRLSRAGRLGDLGALGDGICNLAFIDDVAQAAVAALLAPHAAALPINIGGVAPLTWNDYFIRLGRAIGAVPVARITARRMWCETRLLAPPLEIARRASRKRRLLPEAIPPSLLALWQRGLVLDHRRCDSVLGLDRTPEDVGIARSARWLRQRSADSATVLPRGVPA